MGGFSDNAANNTNNQSNLRVRQELTQMLQKSGYTDIRVAPTSFMVRAKAGWKPGYDVHQSGQFH